ncbi:uncharacterized protein V1518DRAFT_420191 [Limtongia smithiae]|uniref:uncharacterized protein n=1 Tax=Limtongia smithiae TaxID=1125753 RepID=UPI0034CF7493
MAASPLALDLSFEQQQQIASLKAENSQLAETLRKRSKDLGDLNDDYKALQAKHQESRKSVIDLSNRLQAAEAAELNWKLREQNYVQEASLLKNENLYLSSEHAAKTTELLNYRREKSTQISSLEAQLEATLSDNTLLNAAKDSLRIRIEKLTKDHEAALTKVSSWQEKYAASEEHFKSEMQSLQRLADLWERSTNEAKARIAKLEDALQSRHEDEAQNIAQIHTAVEEERDRADEAETRLSALESELQTQVAKREELEQNIEDLTTAATAAPADGQQQIQVASGTPQRNRANQYQGDMSPAVMFSPSARTISQFQRNGLSLSELLTDFNKAKSQLEHERRRNKTIQQSFDDLVLDLESRVPVIQAERDEAARLKIEILNMSNLLDDLERSRDELETENEELLVKASDAGRDAKIYRQQVHDLSRQVSVLLAELQSFTSGVGPLSAAERVELRRLLDSSGTADSESDTSNLISERLVTFKNIIELQQQNQNLLRVCRQLGDKLEQEEAISRRNIESIEAVAIAEKQEKIEQLETEIAKVRISMESYQRQRDSLRNILVGKEAAVVPSEPVRLVKPEDQITKEEYDEVVTRYEESERHLSELRVQYNLYQTEATVDLKRLSSQLDLTKDERLQGQHEVARLRSQLELASERLSVMTDNYDMAKQENTTILARNNEIQENLLKQDIKIQQVSSEVVELKTTIESLRNDNANLNAEKNLFSSTQQRLTQNNEMLTEERNRNTSTIAYLQNMLVEHQQNEADIRKRLSRQSENLETELAAVRQKLDSANDELRNLTIHKQYEISELQRKTKKLTEELAVTKELLSKTQNSEERLQTQIVNLSEKLSATEEKAALYQRQIEETGFSVSKNLEAEVANLREALQTARAEREEAKDHVEQLIDISKAAEIALESMNTTYDEYKASVEQKAVESDAEISRLTAQITSLTQEVMSTKDELLKAQEAVTESSKKLEEETKRLETEVSDLKSNEQTLEANVMILQNDLRRQAGITVESQQNYELELVKHADTTRDLQKLRADFSNLNAHIRDLVQETESAKLALSTGEIVWNEQRMTYENEIERLRSRCNDLIEQNKILHEQFEHLSTQASRARRQSLIQATEARETGEAAEALTNNSTEDMQEIIKFVRHEKELVDAQYEVKLREIKSLQQRLEHTSLQLDEVCAQLDQERERHSGARVADSTQYDQLVKKVEDINILRESNAALREESKRSAAKVVSLEHKLQELEAKVQPLENKLAAANAEVEARDSRIKMVEEDNERWKNRSQHIMQAYQRVDPVELQQLKDENERRKIEVEQLSKVVEGVHAERDAAKKEFEESKQRLTRDMENAIEAKEADVVARLEVTRNELQSALKAKEEEISVLSAEITELNTSLTAKKEEVRYLCPENELYANNFKAESWKTRTDKLRDRFNERITSMNERVKEKDKTIEREQKQVEKLEAQVLDLQQQITKFEEQSVVAAERMTALEAETAKNSPVSAATVTAATPSTEVLVPELSAPSTGSDATDVTDEIAKLKALIAELQSKLAEKQRALETAQLAKQEAENELARVKGELESELSSVKAQLAEVQATPAAGDAPSSSDSISDEATQKRISELEAAVAKHEKSTRETMIRSKLLEVTKAKAEQEVGTLKSALASTKEELAAVKAKTSSSRTGPSGAGTPVSTGSPAVAIRNSAGTPDSGASVASSFTSDSGAQAVRPPSRSPFEIVRQDIGATAATANASLGPGTNVAATGFPITSSRIPTFGSAAPRGLPRPLSGSIQQPANQAGSRYMQNIQSSQIPHRRGAPGSGIPRVGGVAQTDIARTLTNVGAAGSNSAMVMPTGPAALKAPATPGVFGTPSPMPFHGTGTLSGSATVFRPQGAVSPVQQGAKRQHEDDGSTPGTPGPIASDARAVGVGTGESTEEHLSGPPVALKRRREETQP